MKVNFWQVLGALLLVVGLGVLVYERVLAPGKNQPATSGNTGSSVVESSLAPAIGGGAPTTRPATTQPTGR